MTPTELIAEARELDRNATPGPWSVSEAEGDCENPKGCPRNLEECDNDCLKCDNWHWHQGAFVPQTKTIDWGDYTDMNDADAIFIARSRTLLPALCDALEQTQKENAQLIREVSALACESVEREKKLARLEAEVSAAVESYQSGKWEKRPAGHYRCSVCDQVEWEPEVCKYCCNCGARMEAED